MLLPILQELVAEPTLTTEQQPEQEAPPQELEPVVSDESVSDDDRTPLNP